MVDALDHPGYHSIIQLAKQSVRPWRLKPSVMYHLNEGWRGLARPQVTALALGSATSFRSIADMADCGSIVHTDDGSERRIQHCCGGLIEVLKPSLTVQVIHQTVLDYLLRPGCLLSLPFPQSEIVPTKCHEYLLRACIQYLSTPDSKTIPVLTEHPVSQERRWTSQDDVLEKFGFLSYSLVNWVDHYIRAEKGGNSQSKQIEEFG